MLSPAMKAPFMRVHIALLDYRARNMFTWLYCRRFFLTCSWVSTCCKSEVDEWFKVLCTLDQSVRRVLGWRFENGMAQGWLGLSSTPQIWMCNVVSPTIKPSSKSIKISSCMGVLNHPLERWVYFKVCYWVSHITPHCTHSMRFFAFRPCCEEMSQPALCELKQRIGFQDGKANFASAGDMERSCCTYRTLREFEYPLPPPKKTERVPTIQQAVSAD